jgi:FSR family fosmidomycin resistance protein-like MFS transporter
MLVASHAINDLSSNFISGLLPVLTTVFSLSYLLAGGIAMVFNITSSLLQPLTGRWFDRTQAAWLMELGLVVNCIGMSLVGIAPTYPLILFLVGTAGLGSSAFHPPAFSSVARTSQRSRGGAMGVFLSSGNTGFFLGPIFAGLVVSIFGLVGTLLLLPIGITTFLLLLRARKAPGRVTIAESHTKTDTYTIAILAIITALRSITVQGVITFLPLYFVAKGDSIFLATALSSLWLGLGVVGQLAGGMLSDRVGRRPVIIVSLFLGSAFFYGFLATTGPLSLIQLAISGAVLYGGWSVIVAMSSEAAPDHIGAVSGVMLGFSIGIGGVGAVGFGAIADAIGLSAAFYLSTAFAVAAGIVALLLPKQQTLPM